jgi:phytoene dehydrogenase-like protein
MQKTILIIGAGVAGLSAGCFGQMNGYQTEIFELHDIPGGLCTARERKDYVFDGCINYLFGSAPGKPFQQIWQDLGIFEQLSFIHHKEMMRVVDHQGRELIAYSDPSQLEKHMRTLLPVFAGHDIRLVQKLVDGIRGLKNFNMSLMFEKPRSLMRISNWASLGLALAPYLGSLVSWRKFSAKDFADQFDEPFLKKAMAQLFGWPEIPMMAALVLLAYMNQENAGFPLGASLEFTRQLEKRYLELGGKIHYKSQVVKILVRDHRAFGLRLSNDEEILGDHIISTADGKDTIFGLLDGEYVNSSLNKLFPNDETKNAMPIHSQAQVSLGVNRDLSKEPHWVTYLLDNPVLIAGKEHHEISIKHYNFDHNLAPEGKSVLVVMLPSPYHYWQRIYERKLYDAEQQQVVDQVIVEIEKVYPGIKQDIEVTDVATPLGFERYTGNWSSSTCSWLPSKQSMKMMFRGIRKTLPGLDNLTLAGQWVEPGGSVPICAFSGRNAVWMICQQDRQSFIMRS